MKIELFNAGPENFPWGVFILWTLLWLGILARILSRSDFDALNKLLWIVVVIFVPFFGVFLYCFIAPAEASPREAPRKIGRIIPGSDVSGTPWADNPNYTHD